MPINEKKDKNIVVKITKSFKKDVKFAIKYKNYSSVSSFINEKLRNLVNKVKIEIKENS